MASAPDSAPQTAVPVRAAVRRNALWAAGAAGIMLWYGSSEVVFEELSSGEAVFVYTLRFGGGLMALSALFSLTGVRAALAFDALASGVIGAALLTSAAFMYNNLSTQALLNVLFGAVFLHSGYRNWQDYRVLAAPAEALAVKTPSNATEV